MVTQIFTFLSNTIFFFQLIKEKNKSILLLISKKFQNNKNLTKFNNIKATTRHN